MGSRSVVKLKLRNKNAHYDEETIQISLDSNYFLRYFWKTLRVSTDLDIFFHHVSDLITVTLPA